MLDLDECGYPYRAHLIIEDHGTYRITACGVRSCQMRGWWETENGDLPLSGPDDIHCGRTSGQVVAYRTAKGWAAMDDRLRELSWPPVPK